MSIYRLSIVHPAEPDAELYSGKTSSAEALRMTANRLLSAGCAVRMQILDLDGQTQYSLPLSEVQW